MTADTKDKSQPDTSTVLPAEGTSVHARVVHAMRTVGYIGKDQTNTFHRYKFRGIDDVYTHLHKPLADAGVFVIPHVVATDQEWVESDKGKQQLHLILTIEWEIFGADGDFITATTRGQAIDADDKGVNKAMSAAYKDLLIKVLCVPTEGEDDADHGSPRTNGERQAENSRPRQQAQSAPSAPSGGGGGDQLLSDKQRGMIVKKCAEVFQDGERARHALAHWVSDGAVASTTQLTKRQASKVIDLLLKDPAQAKQVALDHDQVLQQKPAAPPAPAEPSDERDDLFGAPGDVPL